MTKMKKAPLIAILFMILFSLGSLFRVNLGAIKLNLASITLFIGIPMYFITWFSEKENRSKADLLNLRAVPKALKNIRVLLLILMPIVMNIICNLLAKLIMPEFIEHLSERTSFLEMNKVPVLIIELLIAALGEEIAWRAFFQNQLTKAIPFVPALFLSSAMFAVCHCTQGDFAVVLYDVIFVFINALFYGLIFKKTNNAFVSTFAHFLANVFAVVYFAFI